MLVFKKKRNRSLSDYCHTATKVTLTKIALTLVKKTLFLIASWPALNFCDSFALSFILQVTVQFI